MRVHTILIRPMTIVACISLHPGLCRVAGISHNLVYLMASRGLALEEEETEAFPV